MVDVPKLVRTLSVMSVVVSTPMALSSPLFRRLLPDKNQSHQFRLRLQRRGPRPTPPRRERCETFLNGDLDQVKLHCA